MGDIACASCGKQVPSGEMTYTDTADLFCRSCHATYEEGREREQALAEAYGGSVPQPRICLRCKEPMMCVSATRHMLQGVLPWGMSYEYRCANGHSFTGAMGVRNVVLLGAGAFFASKAWDMDMDSEAWIRIGFFALGGLLPLYAVYSTVIWLLYRKVPA